MPDGSAIRLKVRSLVGLLPLCAATVFDGRRASTATRSSWSASRSSSRTSPTPCRRSPTCPARARRAGGCSRSSTRTGCGGSSRPCSTRRSSSARTGSARSPAATSTQPCVFDWGGQSYEVHYLPAESDTGMFGGNSNWRGPVWFPMNLVILRGAAAAVPLLRRRLTVECPTGSGREMNLLRGRDGDQPAPDRDVHRGRGRAPAGVRRHREVPDRPALARPAAVPRVLPRRQRRRHRRQPPDRVDRDRRAAASCCADGLRAQPARPPASPSDRLASCACRRRPTVYEINTAVWLQRLGRERGSRSRSTRCPPPSGTRSRRCPSTPSG